MDNKLNEKKMKNKAMLLLAFISSVRFFSLCLKKRIRVLVTLLDGWTYPSYSVAALQRTKHFRIKDRILYSLLKRIVLIKSK